MARELKVGSRPSKLALAQSESVVQAIRALKADCQLTITPIKTSGDLKQGATGAVKRDKKDWIIELEAAIINRAIDFAVHSAKDIPLDIEPGTVIRSILPRAISNDVFIGRLLDGRRCKFSDLKSGAVVGTASLRRRAQVLLARPDLRVEELRGNVPTRIQKLDTEERYDGIVLAGAGLHRLAMLDEQIEVLDSEQLLPAGNQGILAVQYRSDNHELSSLLGGLSDLKTEAMFIAERECLRCLEADCSSAVAIHASEQQNELCLKAKVFSRISSRYIEVQREGSFSAPEGLGKQVGQELIALGASELLIESKF